MKKSFGPTKYPGRHNGTMTLEPRDPRNLAHSSLRYMESFEVKVVIKIAV